jgi:hypothetical protein
MCGHIKDVAAAAVAGEGRMLPPQSVGVSYHTDHHGIVATATSLANHLCAFGVHLLESPLSVTYVTYLGRHYLSPTWVGSIRMIRGSLR